MAIKLTRPLTRFDGFQNLGAFKRPNDTRTVDELRATIELWAKASSEVKEFLPQLDKMNPKHLGLVADTIELANRKALLPNDINLKSQTSAGKTLLGVLLDIFPRASKNNPNSLDFAQEVINNTDAITSKFFLWQTTGGVLENTKVAEHFKVAKPLVEVFAKKSLEPPKIYTFENQEKFMTLVKSVIDEDADPKKVSLVKDIYDKMNENGFLYLWDFVSGKAPIAKIEDNLSTLNKISEMFTKTRERLDVGEYLTKNTNLY